MSVSAINHIKSPAAPAMGGVSSPGKYLTFGLAGEQYGIPILAVQEIIGLQEITAMPQSPAHIRGVINLRGRVIPVVDFRSRLGLEAAADTERTCIIVTTVVRGEGSVITGVVVDSVSEVVDVTRDQIEPPPAFLDSQDEHTICGIGKLADRVVLLIDPHLIPGRDMQIAV